MKRKKWTPQEHVTDALLKSREKRKWQLAFRRYVVEKMPGQQYAAFFGLPIDLYRRWIELQFTRDLNWDNFGKAWQFDHVIPVVYFDYTVELDMKLCWSFINIRVEQLYQEQETGGSVDILAAKGHFQQLYDKTGLALCAEMIQKIDSIEGANKIAQPQMEAFIIENRGLLDSIKELNGEEFNQLNTGTTLKDILLEKEMVRKYGG